MIEKRSHIPETPDTAQKPDFVLFSAEANTWKDIQDELADGVKVFFESYGIDGVDNIGLRDVFATQVIQDISRKLTSIYSNNSPLILDKFHVKNGYLVIYDTTGKEYLYNFDSNLKAHFIPKTLGEVLQEKREVIRKRKEAFAETVQVLEYLFTKNQNEWKGYINQGDAIAQDSIEFAELYKGKNILQIQHIARKQFQKLTVARHTLIGEDSIDKELYPLERQYMTMIMGVGDKYEGGAKVFQKDDLEIKYLVSRQVEARPEIENLLAFLKEEHLKIDQNNWQSDAVKESYEFYTKVLHATILERFKIEFDRTKKSPHLNDTLEKQVISFTNIITGRDGDIDRELTDSYTANRAIILLFSRKGGIMDQFAHHPDIGAISMKDNEYIKKRTPSQIVTQGEKLLSEMIHDLPAKDILKTLGVLHLQGQKITYQELSFTDKGNISLLARLIEKIKPKAVISGRSKKQTQYKKNNIQSSTQLLPLISEIQKEVSWDLVKEVSSKFDGSLSDWNGLDREELASYTNTEGSPLFSPTTLDAIDLFHDINGNGWFEFSDTSNYVSGEVAKFIPIVVGGMIIGTVAVATLPATLGVVGGTGAVLAGGTYTGGALSGTLVGAIAAKSIVVQTAAIGAGASITSRVTHPQGYDSNSEAVINMGSDLVVGGLTGAAGGKIAQQFGIQGARLMSMDQVRNLKVNVPDIAVLGFGAEALRGALVSKIFYKQIIEAGQNSYGQSRLPNPEQFPGRELPDQDTESGTPMLISQKSE